MSKSKTDQYGSTKVDVETSPIGTPKSRLVPSNVARNLAAVLSCSATLFIGTVGDAYAQQVAILDSGVDPTRGFNIVGGFNYFSNTSDTSDVSDREGEGHGTVSARVITEAFSGEIVPFVITDGVSPASSNESQVTVARDLALNDIMGRSEVRVVGFTWGTSGIRDTPAPLVSGLVAANKVVAILAGNESADNPNALSQAHFNLDGAIVVGATDINGDLLATSNRAGITQDKYVAAIGLPTTDAELGGTSWATARISGIAGAVLMQNPNLTAAQVVDVILRSAEDRGAVGTDAEYGRGVILSAQQVLNNVIGTPTVPTPVTPTTPSTPEPVSGGGGGGGGGGALLLGGALAGALLLLRKPSDKLEKTLVLDAYGRGFVIDLNDHVEINDQALHLNQFFHSLEQTGVSDSVYLPTINTQVAFSAITQTDPREDMIKYFSGPDDKAFADERVNVSMGLRSHLSQTVELNAGYKVNPRQEFSGLSETVDNHYFGRSSFITGQSFGSVLSGFNAQAETLSLNYSPRVISNTHFKLGLVSAAAGNNQYEQESVSSIFEGAYQFNDNKNLKLQIGQLEEKGGVLGSAAGGVFGVKSATTYAMNLTGTMQLNDKFNVVANYGIGRTQVDAIADSLLTDFSTLRSDWYSVGAIGNNVFRRQDQMGVAFSQPLKIREGSLNYSIPIGRFANGDVRFDTERVNLSDTNATERSVEAYYRTMLSEHLELGGFISYRSDPNHVSDHDDEALIMATVRWRQ